VASLAKPRGQPSYISVGVVAGRGGEAAARRRMRRRP